MTQTITAEQVWEEMKRIADERPGFVYEPRGGNNCRYVEEPEIEGAEPTEGCLVGHSLVRLGVPVEELLRWERESGPDTADVLLRDLDIPGDTERIIRAQTAQDQKTPWGKAVEV